MSILFWFGLAFVGFCGVALFGIMLLFDGIGAAQFRAEGRETWQLMKGVTIRGAKGSLKLFLISLAVFVVSLLLMAVCSGVRN